MLDILPTLESWISEGRKFATATVTQTWGSSPRPVGSIMAVRDDGAICGSVSGGCVESAVIEASLKALADGTPTELKFDAVSGDSVWDVGLSCGGSIQIWVDPDPAGRNPSFWKSLTESAVASRPKLLIVGSVHIAVPLVTFAKELGFETIVVDPRQAFSDLRRYSTQPDKIVVDWPQAAFERIGLSTETYAAVLTHDPKIDDIALDILLRSPVAYIGALGSRVTQTKRREALQALGHSDETLARIHGPIGLKIGARTPEEIALSVIAEIVQVRRAKESAVDVVIT